MEDKNESIKDFIKRLAISLVSTETDSRAMEALLRKRLGFPNARVVSGIVYLEGHGTLKAPPTSIHILAQQIMKVMPKE